MIMDFNLGIMVVPIKFRLKLSYNIRNKINRFIMVMSSNNFKMKTFFFSETILSKLVNISCIYNITRICDTVQYIYNIYYTVLLYIF